MSVEKSTKPAIIPSQKIYYLDHVKLVLIVLVILHHAFVAYGAPGSWYYKQPATDLKVVLPLTVFVSTNQSFFMGLFFLLSAYFIESSLKRKGTGVYLKDRFYKAGHTFIVLLFYIIAGIELLNLLLRHASQGNFHTIPKRLYRLDRFWRVMVCCRFIVVHPDFCGII